MNLEKDEKYDCDKCREKGLDKERCCGSDELPKRRFQVLSAVPRMFLERCPLQLIDEEVMELWGYFESFKVLGHLPFSGGICEQPNLLVETLVWCETLYNTYSNDPKYLEHQRKQRDKNLKENNLGVKTNLGTLMEKRKVRGR